MMWLLFLPETLLLLRNKKVFIITKQNQTEHRHVLADKKPATSRDNRMCSTCVYLEREHDLNLCTHVVHDVYSTWLKTDICIVVIRIQSSNISYYQPAFHYSICVRVRAQAARQPSALQLGTAGIHRKAKLNDRYIIYLRGYCVRYRHDGRLHR